MIGKVPAFEQTIIQKQRKDKKIWHWSVLLHDYFFRYLLTFYRLIKNENSENLIVIVTDILLSTSFWIIQQSNIDHIDAYSNYARDLVGSFRNPYPWEYQLPPSDQTDDKHLV